MSDPLYFDDFTALDLTKYLTRWWYTPALADGCSLPGNGELQLYVNADGPLRAKPWTVANSVLALTATPDPTHGYLSGMLNSHGQFSRTYGYFAIRAKLPKGAGVWPAFWLLREDGSWPPEIDVFEWINSTPPAVNMGTHSAIGGGNVPQGGFVAIPDPTTDFHEYGVDWQADVCTFYLDGKLVLTAPTPADMNQPMYFIVNLAVGGWAGPPDPAAFPATLLVDWIGVWASHSAKGATTMTGATAQTIISPWADADLSALKPGETATIAFTYDEMSILHDAEGAAIWVRTGKDWTRAARLPRGVTLIG